MLSLCIDEDIDTGCPAYHIEEFNLVVIVTSVGIDDAGEQLGGNELLDIAHAFHDIDGHHAVERAAQTEGVVAYAILDADGVEDGAFVGMHLVVGIDHLNDGECYTNGNQHFHLW